MSPRRRQAFIAYFNALQDEGLRTRGVSAPEAAGIVATEAGKDFLELRFEPLRGKAADELEEWADRVRGKTR